MPALDKADLPGLLRAIETSPNAHVRLTAWRLAHENYASDARVAKLAKPMGSPALALYEKSRGATTAAGRKTVLDAYAGAVDDWTRSAVIAAATEHASSYVADALAYARPSALTDFVAGVTPSALPAAANQLLIAASKAPAAASPLKAAVTRAIARMEAGSVVPDAQTRQALTLLLDDPAANTFAVAIVARWDKAGPLASSLTQHAERLLKELDSTTTSDARRADVASSLLFVPATRARALAAIQTILIDPAGAAPLKASLLATLNDNPSADVNEMLVATVAKTRSTPVFDQIVRRPDSTIALLAALEAGTVTPVMLGPTNLARLRTHPNRDIAKRATTLLDGLSPAAKAKDDIIATLTPEIEKPGDATKGKALFTGTCSACHRLGDVGKSEVGPAAERHGRAWPRRAPRANHRPQSRGRSQLLAVERDDESGRDARRHHRERERHKPDAARAERRRRGEEGRDRLAREYAALGDARGTRSARGRSACATSSRSSKATPDATASSTCAPPTPPTAAEDCGVTTSATRP